MFLREFIRIWIVTIPTINDYPALPSVSLIDFGLLNSECPGEKHNSIETFVDANFLVFRSLYRLEQPVSLPH